MFFNKTPGIDVYIYKTLIKTMVTYEKDIGDE